MFSWLVSLPVFHLHTPSTTFPLSPAPCLPCLPLLSLDWTETSSFFSDLWYPVLDAAFPQEWTNLMINAPSLFCSTLRLLRQTGIECRNLLSACQPIATRHQQTCHLSPPHRHPPTYVLLRLHLFVAFFHYIPHIEESVFITFNYPLCQCSPSSGPLPLIVLHLQLIKMSSSSSLPLFFPVSFFVLNSFLIIFHSSSPFLIGLIFYTPLKLKSLLYKVYLKHATAT